MSDVKHKCRISGAPFVITDSEQEHLHRMGELHPLIREPLPLPSVHPVELLRQMGAFGNALYIYRGESAFSGKPQLTRFCPELGNRICTNDEFWNDEIDNSEFGRAYDFSKPFFEQFHELLRTVYLVPIVNINPENSTYVNGARNLKNCYLCFNSFESEDCLYGVTLYSCSDCLDCVGATRSQLCYASVDIENCYECQHCQDCTGCNNCISCLDCRGCSDCFGSIGLEHARYMVFNEQKTEEEYQTFLNSISLSLRSGRKELLEQTRMHFTASEHDINRCINLENSSGNYLKYSSNAFQCYFSRELQDCGYIFLGSQTKNGWRGFNMNSELTYSSAAVDCQYSIYGYADVNGEKNMYCMHTYNNTANCFGCVSVKGKSHCILNQQYTKEEYEDLVPRIIAHMKTTGEWGEYFPARIAPHTYEENWIREWLEPITFEEAQRRGYRMDPLPGSYAGSKAMQELPDSIEGLAPEEFAGREIECVRTKQGYSFQKAEIDFYRKYAIPLPDLHWRERLRTLLGSRELIPTV